jgi:DNA-binding XRE family transcriptional regulator
MAKNNVQKLREDLLMSKAELARKAGVSALTIDRIESGKSCRMDTKRKIILALGYKLQDKEKVFSKDDPNRKTKNLADSDDTTGDEA